MIKILAISGSLRRASSNTTLLRALVGLAPAGVAINVYGGLGDLALFNPDLEGNEPSSVLDLRAQLRRVDGVLIASPEYAHGITGAMKNALDWLVGSGELENKPVALINASPRATYALASLAEIITTMGGRIIAEASPTVALLGKNLDAAGIIAHPEISPTLHNAIVAFAGAVENHRVNSAF